MFHDHGTKHLFVVREHEARRRLDGRLGSASAKHTVEFRYFNPASTDGPRTRERAPTTRAAKNRRKLVERNENKKKNKK